MAWREPAAGRYRSSGRGGREVKDVFVRGIGQERPTVSPTREFPGIKRNLAPLGHKLANIQAPMRIQVVQDPIITLHFGELRHRMPKVGREILAGPCQTEIPRDLAGGDGERVDQRPRAMADGEKSEGCLRIYKAATKIAPLHFQLARPRTPPTHRAPPFGVWLFPFLLTLEPKHLRLTGCGALA